MVLDKIRDLIADKEPTPNKYTTAMGELIRKAREDAAMSQKELAERIYRRQATLSDLENGKSEVGTVTLVLLAAALDKPITYFFPPFVYQELKPEDFTPLEHELLDTFGAIWSDHLRVLALNMVKVIANFDPTDLVVDLIDTIIEKDKIDEEIK